MCIPKSYHKCHVQFLIIIHGMMFLLEEKKVLSANRYLGQSGSFHSWCSADLNVLNLNEKPLLD